MKWLLLICVMTLTHLHAQEAPKMKRPDGPSVILVGKVIGISEAGTHVLGSIVKPEAYGKKLSGMAVAKDYLVKNTKGAEVGSAWEGMVVPMNSIAALTSNGMAVSAEEVYFANDTKNNRSTLKDSEKYRLAEEHFQKLNDQKPLILVGTVMKLSSEGLWVTGNIVKPAAYKKDYSPVDPKGVFLVKGAPAALVGNRWEGMVRENGVDSTAEPREMKYVTLTIDASYYSLKRTKGGYLLDSHNGLGVSESSF